MKIYTGIRHRDYYPVTRESTEVFVSVDSVKTPLENYFPKKTAFAVPLDWGENHTGFGATNLSASILADYLGLWLPENEKYRVIPKSLVFGFRDAVVRKLNWTEWSVDEETMADFLEEYIDQQQEAREKEIEETDSWEEDEIALPNYNLSFSPDVDEYRGADS